MTASLYSLIRTEKSRCGQCGAALDMLSTDPLHGPSFFVCWPCQSVGQVGAGPVPRADDVPATP